MFVTAKHTGSDNNYWEERRDGHFCGVQFPHLPYMDEPSGIGLRWTWDTIAWDFPYWMMFAVWALTFAKTNGLRRVNLRHLFVVVTSLGVAFGLIASKTSLPLVISMNLMTVAWFVVAIYIGAANLIRNPWLEDATMPQ